MNVAEIIDNQNYCTPDEIELLKLEVELFLKKTEANRAEVLAERSKQFFSPVNLENFFRSKERNEIIGQILQFLITFLDHIPGIAESKNEPINPIEQFRECIRFEVDLLLEEDVKKSVFNEINRVETLTGDNVWDFMERIIEKNRELNELIVTGAGDVSSMFFTLCLVLEQLCLFWFEVKQGNINRTRRTDIYLYKLAKILQDQYQHSRNESNGPVMDNSG